MLPRVKISFKNGALGQVAEMADGCMGFLALGAKAVSNTFALGSAYKLGSVASLDALGVTEANNPLLYKNVKDFYAEAGNGSELWIMGLADSVTFTAALDKDSVNGARQLILASGGKIRAIAAFKTPASGYSPTIKNSLDNDVYTSIPKAQALGVWATEERYAPLLVLIEGYAYNGKPEELTDLRSMSANRVGVVIGDSSKESKNAAMGIVSGRIASSPVQRKISRVKSGALSAPEMYVGGTSADRADVEAVDGKGFVSFRVFVGKAGYFISDDPLAAPLSDDYGSISNRRVVDKAYRICYSTLLENLNDEIPISGDGKLSPAWCAAVEADVEKAAVSQMTANGNLGNDPADPDDTGVECVISRDQNVHASGKVVVGLRVKPSGYARYIDVNLGFKTE